MAQGGDGGFPGEGEGLEGFGGDAILVEIEDDLSQNFKKLCPDALQLLQVIDFLQCLHQRQNF